MVDMWMALGISNKIAKVNRTYFVINNVTLKGRGKRLGQAARVRQDNHTYLDISMRIIDKPEKTEYFSGTRRKNIPKNCQGKVIFG